MSTPARPASKVFAVTLVRNGDWPGDLRQPTLLVAAPSRAAAIRAFNAVGARVTDAYLRDYGYQTRNAHQVEVATAAPGTVFCETGTGERPAYQPMTTEEPR